MAYEKKVKVKISPDDENRFRMTRVSQAPMYRSQDKHFGMRSGETEEQADARWVKQERKNYYLALSDGIFYKVRNPHTREMYEDEKGRLWVTHYKPEKLEEA